jgi:hypothetical protein
MHPRSRAPLAPILAGRLFRQLRPLLESLGWQHDDLASDLYDVAGELAGDTAAACAPLGPELQAHYHGRALASARRLDQCLTVAQHVHGGSAPAAAALREQLARLVRALGERHQQFPVTDGGRVTNSSR